MATTEERTDKLNSLLRGELSSVETYQQAIERVGNGIGGAELRHIENEHREAVSVLRSRIQLRGGDPDTTSGMWGAWAQIVTGAASLLSDNLALKALKEGEEHGLKEYEEALGDEHIDPDTRTLIRSSLVPRQEQHIAALDRLMETGGKK
jgi:uncharacterized protein (TIGR02284 family)